MSGPTNGGSARQLQTLRDSEELHRATLRAISDTVLLADDEGAFKFICPNVDAIFGYVPDEVQAFGTLSGFLGASLFDPDELTAKGEIRNIERDVVAKSGDQRTVLIHLKRVAIKGGTVLCSCRDVTELKLAERELAMTQLNLAHAARLTLVGQLLATIVHEVQQPLVSIRLNAKTALKMLEGQSAVSDAAGTRAILNDIHSASASASDMILRLRNLARKKPIELTALDLNEATTDVLKLIRADIVRRGITLRTELAPIPPVHADRVSLQQVILDLAVNAMEAMHNTTGERLLEIRTRVREESVELVVSDTGDGVADDHKSKLFEPFFTTKPEGMGLGLSTARSILSAHGGQIGLGDTEGRGAAFCVTLPALAT
jgi:PAS domain S-box-containing protein